jgi:alpha-beta hydrolase superfamily lysophospholipase
MDPQQTTLSYPSHNGQTQIHALLWPSPDTQPRGVVQIIHGAAEHSARYTDFAHFLNDKGFVVCASDHLGHGGSISSPADLGDMPLKNGAATLVEDVHGLRQTVSSRYPDLPYFMLGHSMGSFVLRLYMAQHGQGLAGAILSGTNQQPRGISVLGHALARCIAAFRGATFASGLLHNMGLGAYARAIPNARTVFDWISTDPAVVDAYAADAACGMPFTAGGYATLTQLTSKMVKASCARAVPCGLPVLLIAGSQDPVGVQGKGVHAAAEQYRKAGLTNVSLILYDNMRHEVLNEPNKQIVYQDILTWLTPFC